MKEENIRKKPKSNSVKKAKKNLPVAASLLNSIIDQSPYPMWISDEKGTLIRINRSLLDLMNITENEVVGKYNIFKDNIVIGQGYLPLVKRVFKSGETVKFEIRYDSSQLIGLNLASHTFVILAVTMFPIKNPRGKITNAVIQHLDITYQKRMEEEVRKSTEKLRIMEGSITDGFTITDAKGRIIDANKSFCRMIGYSKEELLKMTIPDLDMDAGKTSAVVEAKIKDIVKKGSASFESHLKCKDGKIIHVEISVNYSKELNQFVNYQRDITLRKQTEEAIRNSAELYRVITATSMDGFISADSNGCIIDVNNAFCNMTGYSKYELLRMSIRDIEIKETADEIESYIQKLLKEEPDILETRLLRKDHNIVNVEIRTTFSSQLNQFLIFFRDVTKRKQMEEELYRNAEKYRIVTKSSQSGFMNADSNANIIDVNDAFCKILGYSREDLLNMTIADIEVVEDADDIREHNNRIRVKGSDVFETRQRRKDGEIIDTEILSIYSDELKMFFNFQKDITKQKQAEEALLRSNERIKVMLDTSPLAIFDIDKEGRICSIWNPGAERMFGWAKEEVIGRTSVIVPEDNFNEFMEIHKQVISGQIISGKDVLRKRKDGSIINCTLFASPLYDSKGEISGGIAIVADITERKQAEVALKNAKEYAEELISTANAIVVGLDKNGNVLIFNQKAEEVTGYSFNELKGNSWFGTVVPEENSQPRKEFERLNKGGMPQEFENSIITKSGEMRYIVWRNSTIKDNGNFMGTISFGIDVTDSMRAKEALQASEERYRYLVESLTDDLYAVKFKPDGAVENFYGKRIKAITGYSKNDFNIDPAFWSRLIHKDDREAIEESFRKFFSGDKGKSLEYRIMHKDGSIRWIRNTLVLRYEGDHLVGYDGLLNDITENKQAEEALRISEEKYRDVFERAMEGLFQLTPNGKFMNVNPAFVGMLGYESPADLISNISDIRKEFHVKEDDAGTIIRTIADEGLVTRYECEVFKKDGTKSWISINAHAIKNAAGNVLYYEGSAEDITKRIKDEEEKEKLQSQLQQAQKMEAIGTLTGGVAHDFNNILSVIMGYATLLQMEIEENNPLRMYTDQLVFSAKKAAALTQGLLAFSRKQPVNLKPIKLNEHINSTEKLLNRLLTDDITLKKDLSNDEVTILGDASQIDQILFNMVTNARDAMPHGGTLLIETRILTLDEINVRMFLEGKTGVYALLSVSDTGAGIDKKIKDQIFDPFFTTKEVGKGTGLGLSTVYGIVKQHNGFINFYSEPALGTTFNIYFPIAEDYMEEEKHDSAVAVKGGEKILIAEDNEALRLLMKKVLAKYGYTIIEAGDGEEAVVNYRKNTDINMLILDSVMPKKNGREVYDEIIKLKPDIKVLFTSGYTRDIVLDKGIEEKEVDFISKPLTPDALLEKVREVLDRR